MSALWTPDYAGPVRLLGTPGKRIAWGKRDRRTAAAVIFSMERVNPPLVVPWHPSEHKTIRALRHDSVEHRHAGEATSVFQAARKRLARAIGKRTKADVEAARPPGKSRVRSIRAAGGLV